jgi:16S rRNA (cytidine1402-2'-O)-methyltransferase
MGTVYLIPSLLHEDGMNALPAYILAAVRGCGIFFVENERTTRRYLKQLSRDIIIDDYEWFNMSEPGKVADIFRQKLRSGKNIGLISEAGCPGVADPGQELVKIAQELNAIIKPLVGPNSVLLALMASGLNGQQFRFCGYLPIDTQERIKTIRDLESESARLKCTQIFIETPYRNNQMIESILKTAHPSTRLCIAVDLTGKSEWVKTATISEWQKGKPDIHKRPAIFLILAG